MFIIFGSPRSGTTLLAQCLSAHPEVIVPHETDFIIPAAFVFDRIDDGVARRAILKPLITQSRAFRTSLGEHLDEAEISDIIDRHGDNLPSLLTAIYDAVAERAGAKEAGDKSPNDLMFIRVLLKLGGVLDRIKIVHIVRDIRDVLCSLAQRDWNNDTEAWFPRFWAVTNLYLHEQFRDAGNYYFVRYEDFVRHPARHLATLCGHLDVSGSYLPFMLDPGLRHPRYRAMPHHRTLYEPISDSAVGGYRNLLPPETIARCERQAAEAMATFAYELSGA
jgi:hypothetical protein